MTIENKLSALFDFQKYENNARLASVINKDANAIRELSDDDLNMVSAAGDIMNNEMKGIILREDR